MGDVFETKSGCLCDYLSLFISIFVPRVSVLLRLRLMTRAGGGDQESSGFNGGSSKFESRTFTAKSSLAGGGRRNFGEFQV